MKTKILNRALAPFAAVAATFVVSGLGIHGLTSGAGALQSALQSAGSAHDLETIAAGIQGINGGLYHVLTLRGAQTKGFDAATELRPLLAESDRVAQLLTVWRDTQATMQQKPRVTGLIEQVQRYRGAVDFVTAMLDVDFVSAVSFIQPFDKNFHDLVQSLNSLVHEVQASERADAEGALGMSARTVRVFEGVVGGCAVLALLAAADAARTARRSSVLSRQNIDLARLAQVDALTGLGNRRSFDDRLAAAWSSCTAQQMPLTLIMFDVDQFKKYNDTQGHQAGDAALRQVGGVVAACTRGAGDFAARYGGEEFAIVMPDTAMPGGLSVAERVRQAVEKCAIPHPEGGPAGVITVSLGIATMMPTASMGPETLIELADRGLYAAKRGGRNRAAVAESPAHNKPGLGMNLKDG